jgi:glycosyltransferase involved in cell wall biosynthesis
MLQFHILNPFFSAFGGSELGALEIYRGIAGRCEAALWSERVPDPRLGDLPIRRIDPGDGDCPRGGTLLIHGNFFQPGAWLEASRPDRLILGYNTVVRPELKYRMIERLRRMGGCEIVYASRLVRDWVGIPGEVLPSRIDVQRFHPAPRQAEDRFVIGRLSRDEPDKHHANDPALYLQLAAQGVHVRIMGGTCLAPAIGDANEIELLDTGAEPAPQFLHTLDCFFYRTSTKWTEAGGRVVAEAMACGLPVVCHRLGGYAEWIEDGRTGYLFDGDQQALQILHRLRRDPELRRRVGQAARASMEEMHSERAAQAYFDFFLR